MSLALKHQPAITDRALGYRGTQVLAFVRQTVESAGMAPTYDMICDELGISSRAKVHDIVTRLERRGLLSRAGAGRVRQPRIMLNLSLR